MRGAAATILAVSAALALTIGACAGNRTLARPHPEEVTGPPLCGQCHEGDFPGLDHGAGFGVSHGPASSGRSSVCLSCHKTSFCADCHAGREEVKPTDKNRGLGRDAPHRGDYLTRHRIDGRLDPASCFGCHGRRSDWRCRSCHK
jgi:hypothetical protein